MTTPIKLKRDPIVGEDVNFYVGGVTNNEPVPAKVTFVAAENPGMVRLFFYDGTKPSQEFFHHRDDPFLEEFPKYRRNGVWDFHPVLSIPIDLTLKAEKKAK